jgi:hypothetical protein
MLPSRVPTDPPPAGTRAAPDRPVRARAGQRAPRAVAGAAGLAVLALAAVLAGCGAGTAEAPPSAKSISVIAAGDIAQCNGLLARNKAWEGTARLVNALSTSAPLLVLGDMAYENGTAAEFSECFAPSWGGFLARSYPTPGNHEYNTPGAAPYYDYYGARAGPERRGWYSVDLDGWHLISLNSNVDMSAGSAQYRWLQADLEANKATPCTLAFWHQPRFGSSLGHVVDPNQADVWKLLYQYRTELILNGDEHIYERFGPLDGDGNRDAVRGMRQFTVGTGGADPYSFALKADPNSERRIQGTYGVLTLNLLADRYEYAFVESSNQNALDLGSERCF